MQTRRAQGRFQESLLSIMLALALSGEAAGESLFFSTANHPLGSLSSITLEMNIFGLQNLSIPGISMSGIGLADLDLDASNSGTIDVSDPLGFQLGFQNKNVNFAGIFLVGSVQVTGLKGVLEFGPEPVTNRNFSIDSSSSGALVLNQGLIRTTLTGGALYSTFTSLTGSNIIDLNLSLQPLVFDFSNLGATVISATTDDDSMGLYPFGDEINLPVRGVSTIPWPSRAIATSSLKVSGNLYVSATVPEFHTLGLCSLAVAGVGALAAYRRRVARRSDEEKS